MNERINVRSMGRIELLLGQQRYDLAEQEIGRTLAEQPDNGMLHAQLGLCQWQLKRPDEAKESFAEAIRLSPDHPYPHYLLGHLLGDEKRVRRAHAEADEALRLDPHNADFFGLKARLFLLESKYREAIKAADQGLALDAQDEACQNIRSIALTQLGRSGEATDAIRQSLRDRPDDPNTHANRGWSLLHQNKPKEALVHYREALRLDPTNEWAKAGMVEALKARNPIYRFLLSFFLWMSRLSPRVQIGVLVGGYLAYLGLRYASANVPAIWPVALPLIVAYIVFAIMTWVAVPLFNLVLCASRYGRAALSRTQILGSIIFGSWLLLPVVVFIAGVVLTIATGNRQIGFVGGQTAVDVALLLLPLSAVVLQLGGIRAKYFVGGFLALVGLLIVKAAANLMEAPSADQIGTYYFYAFVASLWIMIIASTRPQTR